MGGMIVYQGCLSRRRLTSPLSTTSPRSFNILLIQATDSHHLKPPLEQGLSVQPCYIRRKGAMNCC